MFERLIIDDLVHWARDYKVRHSRTTATTGCTVPPPPDRAPQASLALAGANNCSIMSCRQAYLTIHSNDTVACCCCDAPMLRVCLCLCPQIDGFRFDIMGHHFVTNMTNIRNALNRLTPEADGVDGRHIYIYGEAWDFGEVALNQRGRNASQHNLVSKTHVLGVTAHDTQCDEQRPRLLLCP